MPENSELQQLVKRAKKGDTEAFGKIYELLLNDIFRYVYFKIGIEDAGDLCIDIFLRVWEHLREYEERKDITFRSWVFRIAHNMVVDYYKKQKSLAPLDEAMQVADLNEDIFPVTNINASLTAVHLQKAMQKIKEEHRQVIILKFINELSNKEIADIIGKSEVAIRIIVHRALKELKEILEKLYPGLE